MSDDPRSDEELLAAHLAGDAGAFPALFHRYGPVVASIVGGGVGRRQDADELLQETFLHLHRAAADFRADRGALRPWLVTIAYNVRRAYFRRRGRRPEVPLDPEGRDDPVVRSGWAEQRDAARQVERALGALPDNQREVIELHWFAGLSFAEVADAVGASLSAVKVRAHRGYSRMRALLGEER